MTEFIMHESVHNAAGVAWVDALSLLPHPFTVPAGQTTAHHRRGTTPTHVTVVAFKGGIDMADAMPNSVLGWKPSDEWKPADVGNVDDDTEEGSRGIICETYKTAVRTVGMPLFALVGNAVPAAVKAATGSPRAIFLPFKTHGLLIYPVSPRGNQDGIKSTIKAVTTAFDFPDPAGMLTLLNFPAPILTSAVPSAGQSYGREDTQVLTASGVLNEILRYAWKVFSNGYPLSVESFVGRDRTSVIRNMYGYAAYNGIDALNQTTFDGTVNSVFGSIIYAAHMLGIRYEQGEKPQMEYLSEVFDTCFVREFFNHQDPYRFVPKSELNRWVHGVAMPASNAVPRSEIERPPGPTLPTLNTVNLIADPRALADAHRVNDNLPCNVSNVYANTINTMSVDEVDVLATSKLILSQNPPAGPMATMASPANYTAMRALQGAMVVDLAAISSENLRRTIGDYCFIMFGYRAESHRDTHKNRDAAIVLFHVCATGPHNRGKREADVTALYAILPTQLNSVKEPAIVLGRFAEKVAAAIKAARLVLSRAFSTSPSRTSTRPEQFNIGMSVTGPMLGTNAIEGLVMAKAFLLLGGSVRANVRDRLLVGDEMEVALWPEAEAGAASQPHLSTSSTSIDDLNQLNLCRIITTDEGASGDTAFTLATEDSLVTSLRMFV